MSLGDFGGLRISVTAAGTIAARRAITYTNIQAAVAGTAILGIAETNAVTGQDLLVSADGTALWNSGSAIAVGAKLTTNATGQCVVAVAGQEVVGRSLTAATAAGQDVLILFAREGILT